MKVPEIKIEYELKPPEEREFWWCSITTSIIASSLITLLVAWLTWPSDWVIFESFKVSFLFMLSRGLIASALVLIYVIATGVTASKMSNSRYSYIRKTDRASILALLTPWVITGVLGFMKALFYFVIVVMVIIVVALFFVDGLSN